MAFRVFRVFALLLATFVAASSQQPPPSTPDAGKAEQQQASPKQSQVAPQENQRVQPPSAVQQAPSDQEGGKQKKSDTDGKGPASIDNPRITDWLVAAFTGGLLLLAVLQWLAMQDQAKQMREGLVETKKAADAAIEGAKAALLSATTAKQALVVSQQADLGIASVQLRHPDPDNMLMGIGVNEANSRIEVAVKNAGATRATEIIHNFRIFAEGVEDLVILEPFNCGSVAPNSLHAGAEITIRSPALREVFPKCQEGSVMLGLVTRRVLSISGTIAYEDVFGNPLGLKFSGRIVEQVELGVYNFVVKVEPKGESNTES
jgi:hypothetical protein